MSKLDGSRLLGARLLVLEEELLIALDIQRIAEEAGATAIDLAHSLDALSAYVRGHPRYDAAIMEVRVQGVSTIAAAAGLQLAGLPVVFATAYGHYRDGVQGFPTSPVVLKPYEAAELVNAIVTAISGHRAVGG